MRGSLTFELQMRVVIELNYVVTMKIAEMKHNFVWLILEPNFPYTQPIFYARWSAAKYPTK